METQVFKRVTLTFSITDWAMLNNAIEGQQRESVALNEFEVWKRLDYLREQIRFAVLNA